MPLLWRLTVPRATARSWPALLAPALRAPRTTALVTTAVSLALAAPAAGMSRELADSADDNRRVLAVLAYLDR